MDSGQEDVQFLGFLVEEASEIKSTLSWRKIFTQITLTLILPLSFIFLTHIAFSNLLYSKIRYTTKAMHETNPNTPQFDSLYNMISSQLIMLSLCQIAYFTLLFIFSLLSTSAVVYTIASIYTPKDLTFKKVIRVFPIVWKRLVLAFIFTIALIFLYNFGTMIVIALWEDIFGVKSGGDAVFVLIIDFYFVAVAHFAVVLQVAIFVIDLEHSWGIEITKKSDEELMKGTMVLSLFTFFTLGFSLVSMTILRLMVNGKISASSRVHGASYGVLWLLLSCLFFFWLHLQSLVYFVFKYYNHEDIDLLALEYDDLEVYGGEYVQLEANLLEQV